MEAFRSLFNGCHLLLDHHRNQENAAVVSRLVANYDLVSFDLCLGQGRRGELTQVTKLIFGLLSDFRAASFWLAGFVVRTSSPR